MSELTFYSLLVVVWISLAVVVFVVLLFIRAPYGRFSRPGWGPLLRPRTGWLLMELPAVVVLLVLFALGERRTWTVVSLTLLGLWLTHYVDRTFFYPLRLRSNRQKMAAATAALGMVFNSGNAYLNARYLFALGPPIPSTWLLDPRFLAGTAVFTLGFALNRYSDQALISLRAPGENGYHIPHGGPFRFVSCPNYLGEILEWGGWALASWNPGGLAFFAWTVANLAPRALATHRWYRQQFPDYPEERKALVPFVL